MPNEPISRVPHGTPSPSQGPERSRDDDPVRRSDDSKRFRKTMKEGREKSRGKAAGKGQMYKAALGAHAGMVLYAAGHQKGGGSGGFGHDRQDGSLTAGMFAMQQAQLALHQATVQPAAATTASMAPALAELIARHVKQLLVPVESATREASREVMLTLNNDILPGTDLWLSRTQQGWRLRAETRSTDAYRLLMEQKPELIERFAKSHLGKLDIDPSLLA